MTRLLTAAGLAVSLALSLAIVPQDTTTMLSKFLSDLRNGTLGVTNAITSVSLGTTPASAGAVRLSNNTSLKVRNAGNSADVSALTVDGSNILTLGDHTNGSGVKVDNDLQILQTAQVTAGTDVATTQIGDVVRQRYQATITPANGVDCATAFKAAALTADCNVATLPAGMKLVGVYADVTAGFTCSGTCTGTKVVQCGTAAGGTQILAASLSVAATGTFGLADADLGSGMTRAAAIQGGLLGSWSTTTPVSCRFTSGTGNWGNASATFVNAGSVKFTFVTEQLK